jgi:branched-chain amino acid transport system ATP-binding protein
MAEPVLEVTGLNVAYAAVQVLHDVTLRVDAGEAVALIGGNGAGKSTTLRAISGLVRPRAGSLRFEGRQLAGRPPEAIARLGIAHVPEGRRIFPGLTVRENLLVGTAARPATAPPIEATLTAVYRLFPRLAERAGQRGWSLSGGEQQMLALGRGLMACPRLLLLDEPSLGLAPQLVREMFDSIRAINEAGTTVLLVEQNAYLALQLARRGYVLEAGRVVLTDTAAALSRRDEVRAAYLGG